MKLFKKVGAGLLLSLGFFCLTIAVIGVIAPGETPQEKKESSDAAVAGIAFGVPMTIAGGWIIRGLQKQYQKILAIAPNQLFIS